MVKKLLYGVAIIIFITLIYHAYELYSYTEQRTETALRKANETTNTLKVQVDSILQIIEGEGERLAALFGANEYTKEEILTIIKESSIGIPELQGITACYEPYAFDDDKRLFCPYFNKSSGDYVFVEDSYDYSDPTLEGTDWYTSVRENGSKWVEPYYAKAGKDWYIDFGIPFHYQTGPKKGQVRGTITMSLVASRFKSLILSLSLGKTGYGIITSKEGNFLSHPINDYVGTTNLKLVQQKEKQPELVRVFDSIRTGKSGTVTYTQLDTDDEVIFQYDKIPTSDWGLGLQFLKKELVGNTSERNHRYIKLALLFSALLLILIAIYFNKDYLDVGEIWQLSILASTLIILNIGFIWYLQHTGTRAFEEQSPPISTTSGLENFVSQQHRRLDNLKLSKSIPVPTGLFIQRMAFENSYNINVSGTVWQKYPLDVADKVQTGFLMPQVSPFAEASYIEEKYRKKIEATINQEGYLLIGYDLRVTLQQSLDYSSFPFDKRHVRIDLVPKNSEDRLLFTPDLDSYEITNPTRKPGLNPEVKISGNRIMKSYFSYTTKSFDTDFGFGSKTLFEEVPILHYNVDLRRKLLNVFITYLIPIFVSLLMIFILIMACAKTEERQGIIEGMAAFFFVLVFSHIDLRKEIITADLIYMEYFYFITYFIIMVTTWNLITYAKSKSPLFDYEENLIFKSLYFPFFFLCVLIVTLAKFY
ncbi:hypothetical protein FGM00_09160 [Aggregatimonas sangjinii]|uniref:Cache domain-containing protein n=1 Tax=Aggregatimonas sangjinii TaxID=2583587 RepID=A0A5B7STS8_9FLAO|nr:cache domain-containing protein [Aggregatimonas sangjinii]QCX00270.1 hypothetical protein FGM00_09160 [Aggregatimonas sangjinii]